MVHYFKILLLFVFQTTFCQFGLLYDNFISEVDEIPTDSLVPYYPLNGNANDESGNGFNATVYNAYIGDSLDRHGVSDHCYYFDGAGDYLSISGYDTLDGFDQYSFSCWLKWKDASFGHYHRILHIGTAGYRLLWLIGERYTDKIRWDLGTTAGTTDGSIISNTTLPTDTWTHIAGTWDGVNLILYQDTAIVGTDATVSNVLRNNDAFYIGGDNVRDYHGLIDDVRVYIRVLTFDEIISLYDE